MIDLSLRPAGINNYPLRGILIPGAAPMDWVREIQRMGFSLERIAAYPVSDLTPNSVWGCLLECEWGKNPPDFRRNTPCQLAHELVFLPEKTTLFPGASTEEIHQLLLGKKHLFHPDLGMVELPNPISWEELITPPESHAVVVSRPEPPAYIPRQVKSFQVFAPAPDEMLKRLEEDHFPEGQQLDNKPLNAFEKQKLAFYQALFSTEPPESKGDSPLVNKLLADYKNLIQRNKNQIDRLLEMLRSDPLEGLKYAIPIDEKGTGRGSGLSEISLFRRWFNFSLFDDPGRQGSGGSSVRAGENDLRRLIDQYKETARALMDKKDYRKAAFVYLKLTKDYRAAALAIEKAELWAEAASIYLKYLQDKKKAAECYEKSKMMNEAIELRKELREFEKAGDLCRSIGKEEAANELYEIAAGQYKQRTQYLKAALILKKKMGRLEAAQDLLLRGWKEHKDPLNCLNNYFANIPDGEEFIEEMRRIYDDRIPSYRLGSFLRALACEYKRRPAQADAIREIAHEIIAKRSGADSGVLSELPHFQPGDPLVIRDLMRYRTKNKK